jgi:nitrite reductase/ring-hydroxylating ferredoxin subunit
LGGVVCPLHGYVFNLTTGFEMTNQQCPALHILPLRADGEGLTVGLPLVE